MPQDGFKDYVEPGGLVDRVNIRVLLCYLVSKVSVPLTAQTISDIILNKSLVNYFELSAGLAELIDQGCIAPVSNNEPVLYSLTKTGREMVDTLAGDLPRSVREKVMESANELVIRKRMLEQNKVTITQVDDGYTMSIQMLDFGSDLLRLTLFVPDRASAERVAQKFYEDPYKVYQGVLHLLLPEEHFGG